jgi:hypothetical protein
VLGVLDAGAEDQPLVALGEEATHLLDDRVGDVVQVDGPLERAGDELAAAGRDAGRVEPRIVAFEISGQRSPARSGRAPGTSYAMSVKSGFLPRCSSPVFSRYGVAVSPMNRTCGFCVRSALITFR